MRQVTIHAAKTNLFRLIEAALAGEDVIIARGGTPLVKLVPIPQAKFRIGILRDKVIGSGPDFFEPAGEDELVPRIW